MQLGLFPNFTVHCFFGRCSVTVAAGDPYTAHDLMEAHYRERHAAAIARLVGTRLMTANHSRVNAYD